ncbi:MAG TPA: hypothetical protein VG408_10595 [Actinomycetota bacterium]|nr:hypothetical protein [Actinomycetota bacterium]
MRKLIAAALATGLLAAIAADAGAKPSSTVVFEDPADDAGLNSQGQPIPEAKQLGVDLVSGTIETLGKNLQFTIELASTTPDGKFLPEAARLLWQLNVGGEEYRFTAKSFDIGKPDVIAGGVGQERIGQVYKDGVVRLEACTEVPAPAVLTLVQCETSLYVTPTFDPAAHTFSWEIPIAEFKGAKKGTAVAAGTSGAASTDCTICIVPHTVERSLTPHTIIDNASVTGIHKI